MILKKIHGGLLEWFQILLMAGIDAVEPGGSTALLKIDFEFWKTVTDPSLAMVESGRARWS